MLHGRIGVDLAPAQMQTFNAPLLDIVYILLLGAFNDAPRLLAAMLAVPHALTVVLVLVLARRVLPRCEALAAVLVGATGVAALPTLATTMNEMAPAACILGAVLLLLGDDGADDPSPRTCLCAGFLGGVAVGLKLTSAPYALGLIAMLPVRTTPERGARLLLWFAGGGLIGAAMTGGFWWWILWQRFGNPVFPYFNDIFRSPWAAPIAMTDTRFMPRSLAQAVFYPLFWAFAPDTLVTELPVRDPRIALGWLAALALAVGAARRRQPNRAAAVLPAFWALSYVAWELCFSILRYLAVLELLSGVLMMMALRPLLVRLTGVWRRVCAIAVVMVLVAVTVYPDWGRATPGTAAVQVELPPIPPGSLVVLLDPSPMAYVAAFAPPGLRFVGANNNLVHPGDRTLLARQIAAAIRTATGPLWGLEMPGESPGVADVTLRVYALRRAAGCVRVRSNLDDDGILACPLIRLSPQGSDPPS